MSQEKGDILSSVRSRVVEPVKAEAQNAGNVSARRSEPVAVSGTASRPMVRQAVTPTPTSVSPGAPRPDPGDSNDILHVGIDLGTSRSAICASNGRRASVPTVVGWPRDPIARRFLGRDIVFGEEVIEKKMSLDVCYPIDSGVIQLSDRDVDGNRSLAGAAKPMEKSKAQKAAVEFLKYLVQLVEPGQHQKIYATIGTPGRISSGHKQALVDAASEVVDRAYITAEPFAVAYSLDALDHVLIVDVGAGTTDLCRVHGSLPEESDFKTLREAGNHIDQVLFNLLSQKYDKAQFTVQQIKEAKEANATVAPVAEPITVTFPVQGRPTPHDITEELRKACQSIVKPIAEAIMELVGTYDPEFQNLLKSHIWLAGGGSLINGLPKAIEDAIVPLGPGVSVRRVDDPVFAGADGALRLAQVVPLEFWEVSV